jgi:hypothetical protein
MGFSVHVIKLIEEMVFQKVNAGEEKIIIAGWQALVWLKALNKAKQTLKCKLKSFGVLKYEKYELIV